MKWKRKKHEIFTEKNVVESEGSMTNLHILIIWTKYLNYMASPFEEKNILT